MKKINAKAATNKLELVPCEHGLIAVVRKPDGTTYAEHNAMTFEEFRRLRKALGLELIECPQ